MRPSGIHGESERKIACPQEKEGWRYSAWGKRAEPTMQVDGKIVTSSLPDNPREYMENESVR